MTYEERVKKKILWLLDAGLWSSRPMAEHIISMQADSIRDYFEEMVLPTCTLVHDQKGWAIIQFEEYLKENGYIPEKEEE